MTFSPRPCIYCGGTSFHVLPDMALEPHKILGGTATQKLGTMWRITAVTCTHCKRTDIFSPTVEKLASHVPGAYVANSPR